jgi:hypothetical protein
MRPDDLLELRRERPFQPFRLHLTDGATYEVRHPELVMVGRSKALIGLPAHDLTPGVFERYHTVALLHITRIEPLETPAAISPS